MLMAAAAVNGAKSRRAGNFQWIDVYLQFRMTESAEKPEIDYMLMPPPPDETEKTKVVDYIRVMTLELAVLADQAGQTALGDYLRAAPAKIDWPAKLPQ